MPFLRRFLKGACTVAALLAVAPHPSLAQQAAQRADQASVSGAVLDPTGAGVPLAEVTLTSTDGTLSRSCASASDGAFTFARLPPGSYRVDVQAVGFDPLTTDTFVVAAHQALRLAPIRLPLARLNTSVIVRPTEAIAEEQIKAQEQQRLLAIFPNFYVSYVPDAAPLTSRQKRSLAFHEAFDWTSFVGASFAAAMEQATNRYPGFGYGASGYAKRWVAGFATERSHELLSHYVFTSLFHQDPRYFYQGTGSTRSRVFHALSRGVVARSDSGKTMPDYAHLLAGVAAAGLANLYYPRSDRGMRLVWTNVLLGIAGRAGQGLIQEFVAKHLTKHVPKSASRGDR